MVHHATLKYTETLLRQAVLAFWRRSVGVVGFLVAQALLVCGLAFLLWSGDRSWMVGALGTVLFLDCAVALAVYFFHLRRSLAKFRAMGSPSAVLTLDEGSVSLASDLGSTSVPWSAVKEVWRFPDFWLLLFSKAQFVTIPLASVSAEMQAFIMTRVSATGGKVVG
jgi:hypothetical protein